jgi:hypothetical protein
VSKKYNLDLWWSVLTKVLPIAVTISSILTAVVPDPDPNTMSGLEMVHKVLDVISLNVLNNTPAQ